jgi:hypothetical protein
MTKEEILNQQASDFRQKWNSDTHDWIFNESSLFFNDILIVAFCREYSVHTDQNAYSMVYIFREDKEPARIYYNKFWDGCPEWRDASLFLKTIVSAEEKDGTIIVAFLTEDSQNKTLSFSK